LSLQCTTKIKITQHVYHYILCCACVLFFLRPVYPMLPVSLVQSIGNCHKYLVYFLPMAWASNSSFSQYLISVVKCSCTRTVKFYLKQGNNTACLQIDIREYWRGNQERTIQRYLWQFPIDCIDKVKHEVMVWFSTALHMCCNNL
jgi:hypothetical protein